MRFSTCLIRSAYNPKLREKGGVYYTPAPVVAYIIKSIQQILVKEFAIAEGLGDSRVLLLDPAAGSLTFPVLAIRLVRDLCIQRGKGGTFPSLVQEHILKNYFGFELLLAPYVIGHLKAKLTLKDLVYQMNPNDRFQLYLTNALEPGIPRAQQSLICYSSHQNRDQNSDFQVRDLFGHSIFEEQTRFVELNLAASFRVIGSTLAVCLLNPLPCRDLFGMKKMRSASI